MDKKKVCLKLDFCLIKSQMSSPKRKNNKKKAKAEESPTSIDDLPDPLFAGVAGVSATSLFVSKSWHERLSKDPDAVASMLVSDSKEDAWRRAAQHGKLGVVEALLRRNGEDKDRPDSKGVAPLAYAAAHGHAGTVELLLAAGVEVDRARHGDNWTALMLSSAEGHVDAVRTLLDGGASVDKTDDFGFSAVFAAVSNGSAEVLDLLIARGANWNLVSTATTMTPLTMACANGGRAAMVQKLLDAGTDVNEIDGRGFAALHYAVADVDAVDVLLGAGADAGLRTPNGDTPLASASYSGNLPTVRRLLVLGSGVDSVNNFGETPLSMAAARGHAEVARALLEAGAVVDHQSNAGSTPLHEAVWRGDVGTVEVLLAGGANVEHHTAAMGSVLEHAIWKGRAAMVQILLEAGAKVHFAYGDTALHSASRYERSDIARTLLAFDPSLLCKRNPCGLAPLTISVHKNDTATLKVLLEAVVPYPDRDQLCEEFWIAVHNGHHKNLGLYVAAGAPVDNAKRGGTTALIYAALLGRGATVAALLALGADVHATTASGQTALQIAKDEGHADVVSVLEEWTTTRSGV